jgi:hypothetical protein
LLHYFKTYQTIIIYKKFPLDLTSNLSFEFQINQTTDFKFDYGYATEENILKFLSKSSDISITKFEEGKLNFNETLLNGTFSLIESEINTLNSLNNALYICILINSSVSFNSISIQFFEKNNLIEILNNDDLSYSYPKNI